MTKEELDKEIEKQDKEVKKLRKKYEKAQELLDDWETKRGYKKRVRNLNRACYKWSKALEKKRYADMVLS